ncbi:hypothetical protein G9A89_004506 [Geosiphon pyriformis]|nr:hypothetical protein G9A89_004506 [Geosiphon pyriformis]
MKKLNQNKKKPQKKKKIATAYIAKISEFTDEDNDTSLQEWLDKVQKARDANGWNAARMLKAISYFLQRTAGECYYQLALQPMQQQYQQPLPIQQYQTLSTQQYQIPVRRLVQHNQFTFQNQFSNNNSRSNPNNQLVSQNSGQQRPNHYHTQSSYLTMPEGSNFQQTALSEGEVAAPRSNLSNNTISSAQIAQNANLSDIFSFEFEANELPFLLSNAAANEQKAITVMYIEATVEEKSIQLILDNESAESIITCQLMQQLQRTVNRPAQTVIITADVPATCGTFNKQSEKAPVFEFEEKKKMPLTETYIALGLTSNWAEKTEQEIFEESRG